MMGRDVWLYARISMDRSGLSVGVERQLRDEREAAERAGDSVVAEFRDDDRSALKAGNRPGYDDLMAGIADGTLPPFGYAYQQSRLWRNRRERADAIELLRDRRGQITMLRGPVLDFTTAYGRGQVGLMGEFDTMESEVKGERVEDAAIERADAGKASGVCPYGWRRERVMDARGNVVDWYDVVDPKAAAIVREIVDRLLAGESLRSITADLNARGVRPPYGGAAWGKSSVAKVAIRHANIALRVHHKGRPDERLLPAAWDPIVPEAQHHAVCALLAAPERRTSRSGARKHLLSYGVGECGVCDGRLALTRGKTYVCEQGHTGRNQAHLDDYVSKVIIARLSEPDALDIFTQPGPSGRAAADEVEGLRAQLALAADKFAAKRLTMEQLLRINGALIPDLEAAEARLPRPASSLAVVASIVGPDVGARWYGLGVERQHAVLDALGLRVRIMPTRRGPTFRTEDVQIVWP